MQTDTVAACLIENNDHVVLNGQYAGYVYIVEDADNDQIIIDVCDDEGEHNPITLAPFDPVTIVTSFEED